jgi:pilus assembly protein CpaF
LLLKKAHGILIAGPTGSGKTTFLAAFLQEFCHLERTVILEAIPELPAPGPHGINLCERIASLEGMGAVSLERLVAESLRLRPDRLVFGEIRGREARAFWEAISSGHQATIGTIHAASADEARSRLAFLAASHGAPMIQEVSQAGAMGVIVLERGNPPRVVSVNLPSSEIKGEKL